MGAAWPGKAGRGKDITMTRIEFTDRMKLQGFERCCRDGSPHCEACGRRIIGVCWDDGDKP